MTTEATANGKEPHRPQSELLSAINTGWASLTDAVSQLSETH